MTIRVTAVVGARPNFMKIAPILRALRSRGGFDTSLVHTGQHYDARMSDRFFQELGIPAPDEHLGVGSNSHAVQTADVMTAFDRILDSRQPDVVIVVGDVNSTLACALTAAKRHIAVAHVEAGLRSGDRTMPEELNRIVTDQLSDFLFTTEESARANLEREGIDPSKIHFVGNVMIDTLLANRARALREVPLSRFGLRPRDYALCTVHRPSNVDTPDAAARTLAAIGELARRIPVLLPLHPRTRARWAELGLSPTAGHANVHVVEPLGYLECVALMDQARVVLTDSGGLQEETTALGVPCLTFRENTERPITIQLGTNQLVGTSPQRVAEALDELLAGADSPRTTRPPFWDGRASERIANVLAALPSLLPAVAAGAPAC